MDAFADENRSNIDMFSTMDNIGNHLRNFGISDIIIKDLTHALVDTIRSFNPRDHYGYTSFITKTAVKYIINILRNRFDSHIFQKNKLNIVTIFGMPGSGKTSFCGKFAHKLKKSGHGNILVTSVDKKRPAAQSQLQSICMRNNINFFCDPDMNNMCDIANSSIEYATKNNFNVLIIDTPGVSGLDQVQIDQFSHMKNDINPIENICVIDGLCGKNSLQRVKDLDNIINGDTIVLTKMDQDDLCIGAIINAKYHMNKPLSYITNGENISNIEKFDTYRTLGAIFDINHDKIRREFVDIGNSQEINLTDILNNLLKLKKSIIEDKDSDRDISHINKNIAIIMSMTTYEKQNPEIIRSSQINRIATGSGVDVSDVNELLQMADNINIKISEQHLIKK